MSMYFLIDNVIRSEHEKNGRQMYALASETQEEIYDISHTHSSLFGRWEKKGEENVES